ncbi:MAG TPA: AAA family ATPase, partial [Kofleriaceae bacterium]|nr:AAA family ATPase [Kofleriaceae bacterium]
MHIEKLLLRDVGPFDDVMIEFPKGTDPQLADVYLLTGPNGTGKSTILYALAWLIGGVDSKGGQVELGHDLLAARIRSKTALAALITDDQQVFAATHPMYHPISDLYARFGPEDLGLTLVGDNTGALVHWHREVPYRYANEAAAFQPDGPPEFRPRFSWAAFAYAGLRSVTDVEITAIQEPKRSPFDKSLSFLQTADTSQLANWIASQNFRRLKAKEVGHAERAEQLARSVRDIETVIAQIVDDPDFGFVITDEDDNVRARWKGTVIRLGLLPDGLKSIVSWVADLLMRLDRIPWQGDTPVLQRSFLLLLDEVDIHLHPAWQRRVLPLAQRLFPNAQIIASTHSPFVVASVDDARIITLAFQGRSSVVTDVASPQIGVSYTAVLRSIFGIDSEFDIDTERNLDEFH